MPMNFPNHVSGTAALRLKTRFRALAATGNRDKALAIRDRLDARDKAAPASSDTRENTHE
ncbi:MAG: hypothetical protein EOL86_10850 [Deltaproteobacteria bacterium]|nr:hypothetical protein [Deltaproteobacteria bacterium]